MAVKINATARPRPITPWLATWFVRFATVWPLSSNIEDIGVDPGLAPSRELRAPCYISVLEMREPAYINTESSLAKYTAELDEELLRIVSTYGELAQKNHTRATSAGLPAPGPPEAAKDVPEGDD
ncbi:uncharacterized protein FIBRA_04613 [Fibroporia radiculosa]|uniref:Uncharacterized protein n=1 Tax=Fibroporia radiculosa TaxID=599839 RepID=J4IA93_9APHY|nr:uncharacterized protein FIBRA_04613 [Fibroporia radiculosa]CCM02511.1 predicted protein [Fibroporia radiculosa]